MWTLPRDPVTAAWQQLPTQSVPCLHAERVPKTPTGKKIKLKTTQRFYNTGRAEGILMTLLRSLFTWRSKFKPIRAKDDCAPEMEITTKPLSLYTVKVSRTEKQPAGEAYFITFRSALSIRRQTQAHAHLLLPMLAGRPTFCMRCSHSLTRCPHTHRCVLFKMLRGALNTSVHGSRTTLSLIPNARRPTPKVDVQTLFNK